MSRSLLAFILCMISLQLYSQTPELIKIRRKLDQANAEVTNFQPQGKYGMIVTNQAVNKLLADKVASYLSGDGDLSLYKTYATLNSSDGTVSLSHNFPVSYSTSGLIKLVHTLSAKVNALDGFATVFSNHKFSSELSMSYKVTIFGRGAISFDGLIQPGRIVRTPLPGVRTQKTVMDAHRTLIVNKLKAEMTIKAADFENSLTKAIAQNNVVKDERDIMRETFYKDLDDEYTDDFTAQQIEALNTTKSYNLLKDHWTSLSISVPITSKSYKVAETYLTNFTDKNLCPWEVSATYTAIRESNYGNLFMSIGGSVYYNNNILTEDLTKVNVRKFVTRPDSSSTETSTEEVYIGSYDSFVTPKLRGQLVVFPKDWNVGLSLVAEQHIGKYNPLNARVGIPIRLNDKDGKPTVNFEIQGRLTDLTNQIKPNDSFWDKASIGLSVGLPFTTIVQ